MRTMPLLGPALVIGLLGARTAAAQRAGEMQDWRIVPGQRFGPITADVPERDLVSLLGPDQVEPGDIHVGEDCWEPGAVLYPGDPLRRAEIVWGDADGRSHPTRVTVRGDSSVWHVEGGITLGTSLRALERLNGAEFVLHGFGWDYSGTVASWEGGTLVRLDQPSGRVLLALDPPAIGFPPEVYEAVMGSGEFASSHPALRQLNPRVSRIVMLFPPPRR